MRPSSLLTDLLLQYYAALTVGDVAALERLVAADAVAIGPTPPSG